MWISGLLTPQHSDSHACIRPPSWGTQWTQINAGRVSLGETSELNGVIKANRANNLGDLLVCLVVLVICYGIFGVLITAKRLINDSWWIPIRFGWFLELPKFSPNLDPGTPALWLLLYQNTSKNIKGIWEHFKSILCSIYENQNVFRKCVYNMFIFILYIYIYFEYIICKLYFTKMRIGKWLIFH